MFPAEHGHLLLGDCPNVDDMIWMIGKIDDEWMIIIDPNGFLSFRIFWTSSGSWASCCSRAAYRFVVFWALVLFRLGSYWIDWNGRFRRLLSRRRPAKSLSNRFNVLYLQSRIDLDPSSHRGRHWTAISIAHTASSPMEWYDLITRHLHTIMDRHDVLSMMIKVVFRGYVILRMSVSFAVL